MTKTKNTPNSNDTEPKPKTKERSTWKDGTSILLDLSGAVSFRFIDDGWEKKELLEMFAEMVDESIDNLVEFEKEEVA